MWTWFVGLMSCCVKRKLIREMQYGKVEVVWRSAYLGVVQNYWFIRNINIFE